MLHLEEGFKCLIDCLSKNGMVFDISENEGIGIASVSGGNYSVDAWFDDKSQKFYFKLLTGLPRQFDTADSMVDSINYYLHMQTYFTEKARIVVDAFSVVVSQEFDFSCVATDAEYSENSFKVIYKSVTSERKHVVVTLDENNIYHASLCEYSDAGNKRRVLNLYLYKFDGDELMLVPNMCSYMDRLLSENEEVTIEKIDSSSFLVKLDEDRSMKILVSFPDDGVQLRVFALNDAYTDCVVSNGVNLYSLEDIYSYVSSDFSYGTENTDEVEDTNEPDVVEDTDETGSSEFNLISVTLIKTGTGDDYLQFYCDEGLYNMSIQSAKENGIRLNAVMNTEEISITKGVAITNAERLLRMFADDVSDDVFKCKSLISSLFDA